MATCGLCERVCMFVLYTHVHLCVCMSGLLLVDVSVHLLTLGVVQSVMPQRLPAE